MDLRMAGGGSDLVGETGGTEDDLPVARSSCGDPISLQALRFACGYPPLARVFVRQVALFRPHRRTVLAPVGTGVVGART